MSRNSWNNESRKYFHYVSAQWTSIIVISRRVSSVHSTQNSISKTFPKCDTWIKRGGSFSKDLANTFSQDLIKTNDAAVTGTRPRRSSSLYTLSPFSFIFVLSLLTFVFSVLRTPRRDDITQVISWRHDLSSLCSTSLCSCLSSPAINVSVTPAHIDQLRPIPVHSGRTPWRFLSLSLSNKQHRGLASYSSKLLRVFLCHDVISKSYLC